MTRVKYIGCRWEGGLARCVDRQVAQAKQSQVEHQLCQRL